MALAIDGSVITSEQTATNAITVASNSNRILIATIGCHQGSNVSGITANGTAMTLIKRQTGSFNEYVDIWGLVAPDIGTYNVVVSGVTSYWAMGIYSIYGAAQSLPTIFSGASGGSGSATTSVTTTVDNSLVISVVESEPIPTMSTVGGTQDYYQQGQSFENVMGSRILKTPAGSQTKTYGMSFGARWNIAAVAIAPVAAGVAEDATALSLGVMI